MRKTIEMAIAIAIAMMTLCQSTAGNATQHCRPETLPSLVKKLHGKDMAERLQAARGIGDLGCGASEAVNELLLAIDRRGNESFRTEIVEAIGKIGPRASIAVPKLRYLLRDSDHLVRVEATAALFKVEGHSAEAEKSLTALLSDSSNTVRDFAAGEVFEISPALKGLIPTIVKLLGDPNAFVRLDAIMALGHMGPSARDSRQLLLSLPANTEPDTKELAEEMAKVSLAAINSDVQSLLNALDAKDETVRVFAAMCIGDLGPAAKPYLANLERCLRSCKRDDSREEIRRAMNKVEGIVDPCCSETDIR